MTTHDNERRAAPSEPAPDQVGDHLVIDKREWIPGHHPDPHRRNGERGYFETFFRCVRCGEQRLHKRQFPDECTPSEPAAGQSAGTTEGSTAGE